MSRMRFSDVLPAYRIRWLLILSLFAIGFFPSILPFEIGKSPCMSKQLTGIEIGTCGLARGFLAVSRGDIAQATKFNPLSFPLWLLFLKMMTTGLLQEITKRDADENLPTWLRTSNLVLATGIAVLVLTVIRMNGWLLAG